MAIRLRLAALALAVLTVGLWFFGGPNWGRTQLRVPQTVTNGETGQERVIWENRILPGTDFLLGGLGIAVAVWGVSLGLTRRKESHAH